jgi:hypothetical protein
MKKRCHKLIHVRVLAVSLGASVRWEAVSPDTQFHFYNAGRHFF